MLPSFPGLDTGSGLEMGGADPDLADAVASGPRGKNAAGQGAESAAELLGLEEPAARGQSEGVERKVEPLATAFATFSVSMQAAGCEDMQSRLALP